MNTKTKTIGLFAIALLALTALVGSAQAAIDLNVTSISVNPGDTRADDIVRVYVNESNNISAVVYNGGGDAAGAFDVCFKDDANGVNIGTVNVPGGLAAGTSTTVSIDWTPTCGDYSVMPGFPAQSLSLTINVTADCNGAVTESDETNNTLLKVIPAIQVYKTYNVIGGVVNNGYKSKNFDCDTTEEPLDQFKYYDLIGGGIAYNVSGTKISSFDPSATSTRDHQIVIPTGATVKEARLYVHWYDKWGNYKTYPTGCLANLSVNFDGTDFMPDVAYNDQKGFGYYHSPKGNYAFDVTSKVTGSGSYTAIVKNIDPANKTTLLGEMLVVVYEGANNDNVQLWVLEGNDYLMAADETHNSYDYSVSPEEATSTVALSGEIDVPECIASATLVTVVAQGMAPGSNMLFNGEVIKTDAWDSPTEAYSGSKVNVESVDVKSYLTASGNNMGFQDNGTAGMQASNAFLVVEYKEPIVSYGDNVYRKRNVRRAWNALGEPDNRGALLSRNAHIAIELNETIPTCTKVSVWVRRVAVRPPTFEVGVSSDGKDWTKIGSERCTSWKWTRYDFTGDWEDVKYIGIRKPGGPRKPKLMGLDAVRAEGC